MTPSPASPAVRALGLLLPLAAVLTLATGCWLVDPLFGLPVATPSTAVDATTASGEVGRSTGFCTTGVWFRTGDDAPAAPFGFAIVDWGDGTDPEVRPMTGLEGAVGRFCVSHAYAREGTYLASVSYWPGYQGTDDVVVTITRPDVAVGIGCEVDGSSMVTVDASWLALASYPLDPSISWLWTWGDGSPSEVVAGSPIRQHRYTAPGTYRVWVATARGGAWLQSTSVDVTIEPCTL